MYGQLYHRLKDKIHTTPDTPEIRQVKKTQEAVSEVSIFLRERAGCGTPGGMSAMWSLMCVFWAIFSVDLQIRLLQDARPRDLTALHTPSDPLPLRGRHHQ